MAGESVSPPYPALVQLTLSPSLSVFH